MRLRWALCALIAVVMCTAVFAQSITSGDIAGTITDPSSAPVPNASVVTENVATGLRQSGITSSAGTFRIPLLPPGDYKVTIAAAGFQIVETKATVVIGGTAEVAVGVPLKTESTSVEVLSLIHI